MCSFGRAAPSGATGQGGWTRWGGGLLYLPYQSAAQRQAARSPPPPAPSPQHNHLDTHRAHSPPQTRFITVHQLHPTLIASFIPIYFCHPGDLCICTVEAGGSGWRAPRLLVSIQPRQFLLLSSITAGHFNQMTCNRGIKYPCD